MKLQFWLFGLACLATRVSSASPVGQKAKIAQDNSVVPGAYIVEFEEAGDAETLYDDLRAEGLSIAHRMNLNYDLFKGASFTLSGSVNHHVAAAKIATKQQIKSIWPVRRVQFPKPEIVGVARNLSTDAQSEGPSRKRQTTDHDEQTTHLMAQVSKLHEEGFTGKGVRIGIVDTGVDYKHPALGGCFGPGCLVQYGYDLTGDNFSYDGTGLEPDEDPLDICVGHGTHVSGIVAAQENEVGFTGVAPGAVLGVYKTCGCTGHTTSDILLAAFNMAYEDGSNIISCSAGHDSGWTDEVYAMIASRIAAKGVPVVVAIGNSGDMGVWQSYSPASGKPVTGVGSVDNTINPRILLAGSTMSDNSTKTSTFGWRQGVPGIGRTNVTMELWAASTDPASGDTACAPLSSDTPDLSDKITLLRFPSKCTIERQADNVIAKGGKYIMFYPQMESQFGNIYLETKGLKGIGLVTPKTGTEWVKAQKAGRKLRVTLTEPRTSKSTMEGFDGGPLAGYLSAFSSWGPNWDTELKPQFVAPGGNILSTWISDEGAYTVLSGTSMSTPFAAGVFALVGEVRGSLDARILRNVLSTTSKPLGWHDGLKAQDILAPVAQQGAGILQAYSAAHAVSVLSVESLSLNDSDHFVAKHSFKIENTGNEPITYSLSHVKAATVYTFERGTRRLYPKVSPPQTAQAWAELEFESTSISVPSKGTGTVTVNFVPPSGLNDTLLPVYGGYISLNATNGETLSVPYLGIAGSLYNTRVLTPGYDVVSSVGVYLSSTFNQFPVPANRTFTIPRPVANFTAPPATVFPKVVVVPSVGMSHLRVDIVAVGNTNATVLEEWFGIQSLGQLPDISKGFASQLGFASYFHGITDDKTILPPGSYRFVVSALRIFGDVNKKEDWDIVELVPFHLKYT